MLNRHRIAALIGFLFGLYVSHCAAETLHASTGWKDVSTKDPRLARYVHTVVVTPWPIAGYLVGAAIFMFLRVRTGIQAEARVVKPLPPYPYDPGKTQLVIGEVHSPEGTRSDNPRWMVCPEKGLMTGILVMGATGSAKTSAVQYPYTQQLINLHRDDPNRKIGGLIIDAKGNYADAVRQWCINAGREEDYYEISLTSGVRYNLIGRPDLGASELGSHIAEVVENVQGKGTADPFWKQEGVDLATNCIRVIRLATGREPTLSDIYRVATSPATFRQWYDDAQANIKNDSDFAEAQSVKFWMEEKLGKMDEKLRGSISATLNGAIAMFDQPKFKHVFCPEGDEANFLGFPELLRRGQIVALKIPRQDLKVVADVVGTMTKLNYYDCILQRLSHAEQRGGENNDPGRVLMLVADEFDCFLSPGDSNLLSKSREAKLCAIIATQSMESIITKLGGDTHAANKLIAQLRTKIWLCCEDTLTAKEGAELIGQVEKEKVTVNWGESGAGSYSFTDGKTITSGRDSMSQGTSVVTQREYLYHPVDFTSLRLNEAIIKMFDGTRVRKPTRVFLKPHYRNPNESWFDGPDAIEPED